MCTGKRSSRCAFFSAVADLVLIADERDLEAAGRLGEGELHAFDHYGGAKVASHRVDADARDLGHQRARWIARDLISPRRNDLFAVVVAAIGTDPVRQLGAVAVAAGMKPGP